MKPLAQNTMIQNRYLIVQLIGKGGMGEVYLAVDQRLGSAVALKRTFFAGDELLGNAFEREARILARMRHPVLPKVSDHFLEGSEQYLVMEHISGDDLSKRLDVAQKPFPLSWVMFWADQLLDALSYLHSHEPPIIHRDIKPQNLKLTDENHIVLLDFGLSKSSTGNTNLAPTSGRSGSTGSVVGYTPHYAPMEQIRGIGTNPRSDIYALSATLYQLLTNEVPADALSRADSMLNGKDDPIRAISEINVEVPKVISDVILKGMEVSQEKRFETAREMQKALRKAFASIQAAMSAETIAFTLPVEGRAATDVPIAPTMDKTEVMDFGRLTEPDDADSVATRVANAKANGADASGGYNSMPRQADVQTEVFNAGTTPLPMPGADSLTSGHEPAEQFATRIDENQFAPAETPYYDSGTAPDATVPVIAFDNATAETPAEFGVSESPVSSQGDSQISAAPAKKGSGGKIAAVFGGLAALFVLGAVAVVGGWYVYNNYYAGAADLTPTPEATPIVELTPTPEPTIDPNVYGTGDANANTSDPGVTDSNTAVPDASPSPGTNGETRPRTSTPSTRQTRPPGTSSAPRPTPEPTRRRPATLQ